jgi:ankyrin repeat protein
MMASHHRLPMSKRLKWAIKNGRTDRLETLVKKGTNIMDTTTEDGETALMLACNAGQGEVMLMLVEMGYDVNMEYLDSLVQKTLYKAVSNGYVNSVKVLLDKGADINMKNINGDTVLLNASNLGQTEMVKMFLEKGADVNACNNWGRTPMIDATRCRRTEIVSILLDNGADINKAENNGDTPLYVALQEGHVDMVRLLLEKGADVNAKNNDGWTALMWASEKGYAKIVSMLLKNGADVNAKNNGGWTALMKASQEAYKEIVEILLKNGADVNAVTKNGYTALKLVNIRSCFQYSNNGKAITALIKKYIRRTELMNQTLKTALVIKKGLTQKGNKPLMPTAHRDTIHRIASFF